MTISSLLKKKQKVNQMGFKKNGGGGGLRYERFLLFPQYFQKTCTADT